LLIDTVRDLSPVVQALLATLFTWGVTALGAATVYLTREFSQRFLDWILGFAAGVMVAASFWSLLAPGIEIAEKQGVPPYIPAVIGFLAGGAVLRGIDRVLPHLHVGAERRDAEGVPTTWRRSILLVTAITLHNIPEGLAVGVSFGAVGASISNGATFEGAVALALGIGLQNFPEGISVSMPLRREGLTRNRCFFYGQLSGMVEPAAGVLGALAVILVEPLLPYALAFAAGAMIFVVAEDVIPEAQRNGNVDLATFGVMIGFAVMMTLDVALG
jgi:zinc transporter, ZIP family